MNCLKGIATFCSRGQKPEEEEQSLKGDTSGAGVAAPVRAAQAAPKQDSKPVDPAPKAASTPSAPAAAPDAVKKVDPAPKAASTPSAPAAAPDAVKKAESNGAKAERRRAPDGRWYTRDEFIKFFGKKAGESNWKWASRT
eukprot:symbB.v1.2.011637.t1/scaffold740.1/size166498/17